MNIYSLQWLSPVKDWRVIATYATRKRAIEALKRAKEEHNGRYTYRIIESRRYGDMYFPDYVIDMDLKTTEY